MLGDSHFAINKENKVSGSLYECSLTYCWALTEWILNTVFHKTPLISVYQKISSCIHIGTSSILFYFIYPPPTDKFVTSLSLSLTPELSDSNSHRCLHGTFSDRFDSKPLRSTNFTHTHTHTQKCECWLLLSRTALFI